MNKLDNFIKKQVTSMLYLGQLAIDTEREPFKVGFAIGYAEDTLIAGTELGDMYSDSSKVRMSIEILLGLIQVNSNDIAVYEMYKELGRTVSKYRRSTLSKGVKHELDDFVIAEMAKITGDDELAEYLSIKKGARANNVVHLNQVN